MEPLKHSQLLRVVLLATSWVTLQSACPPPFQLQWSSGLCLNMEQAKNFTWCSANSKCAAMGGELMNSYESLSRLMSSNLSSYSYVNNMWIGLTDIGWEVGTSRSGWQRINGRGVLPADNSLWSGSEPSGGTIENCVRARYDSFKLADNGCRSLYGFICEYVQSPTQATDSAFGTWWARVPFKRQRSADFYCFTDAAANASTPQACLMSAIQSGSSFRSALYNAAFGGCRLLQFADAQVEAEIEYVEDWIKFSRD